MISPGTIKAASLIGKGVSPQTALAEANRIDALAASRKEFLRASASTNVSQGTSTADVSAPSTIAPSPNVPSSTKVASGVTGFSLGNITSAVSTSSQVKPKNLTTDEINAINKIAQNVQSPATKKSIQLGDPNAIVSDEVTKQGLAKLNPKQLGELQINLQSTLIQSKIDSLPNNISKLNYVPQSYQGKNYNNELLTKLDKVYNDYSVTEGMDYPTMAATFAKEHKEKLSSYQKLVNDFLGSKDVESLNKGYQSIKKELEHIDNTSTAYLKDTERYVRSGRGSIGDKAYVQGNIPAEFAKAKKNSDLLLAEIEDVYKNRSQAMLASKTLEILDSRYKNIQKINPNLTKEKFFEEQTKKYSLKQSPFGLGQVLVEEGVFANYQEFIKYTNPGKYSDAFKGSDIDFKGIDPSVTNPKDVNSYALAASERYESTFKNKDFDQTRSKASGDYRFADAKDDILFSGIQFAQRISEELYQKSINTIREREQLNLDYQKKQAKGVLTETDKKKYETRLGELNQTVDYSDAFDKSIAKTYNYEELKNNPLVKNFAEDRRLFLEKETQWNKLRNDPNQTAWYQDWAVGYFGGDFRKTQTGAKVNEAFSRFWQKSVGMATEGMKFADQTILNETLGVPRSSDYRSRNAFYNDMRKRLEVPTVIDERASILAGKPITSTTMFWQDAGSSWYDPRGWNLSFNGTLNTAAETIPQVLAFAGAGRTVQSLGGAFLQTGIRSGVTTSLLGEVNAARFAKTLQASKSTATAWGTTFRGSNNFLLKNVLADRLPSAIGMTAVMYPEQYNRTVERLEAQGVKNAQEIARNIATLSTAVELVAENIFPNLKYLDDFAEKGIGLSNLAGKFGKKWTGDFNQYRNLYSGLLGGKLSENALGFLARNSADVFGKLSSAGRFYIARGTEEGLEEIFSEITNASIDAFTDYANYRREPAQSLDFEGIVNAFAGGFFVPSAGGGRQIKAYTENKKYSAMYDMMVNADYYKNKINSAFKAGELDETQASNMLARLQDLVAVSDEYGVQNLKNRADAATFTSDLVNDQEKQFDYFKQILKVRGIETKLASDDPTLTEDRRKELIAEAEEATQRIDKYKRQVAVFENMSDDQKNQIVQNTIRAKVEDARYTTTSQVLAESIINAETQLGRAIKEKQPSRHIEGLREYHSQLVRVQEQREQAKQEAIARGTYNPLASAIATEGEVPPLDTSGIKEVQDAEDMVVQAMIDPDNGSDLYFHITGQNQNELDKLKKDREDLTEVFLDHLEETEGLPDETNPKETEPTTADQKKERTKYQTINDLSDEQVELFQSLAEKMDEEIGEMENKVKKYDALLTDILIAGVNTGKMSLAQQENFAKNIIKKFASVKKVGFSKASNTGGELIDTLTFAEYLATNKDAINKELAKFEELEKQSDQQDEIERAEVSLEEVGETPVVVPELIPEDMTEEFQDAVEVLEELPTEENEVVVNEVTGESEVVTSIPKERTEYVNNAIADIVKTTDLNSAKAKMAALMQALGKDNAQIQKTLKQMDMVANNEPVEESDYTHTFGLYQLARMTQPAAPTSQAVANAAVQLGIEFPEVAVEEVKNQKTIIEEKIAGIQNQIDSLNYFIGGTDSYAAIKRAEQDIANYKQRIKELKEELVALEQPSQPTDTRTITEKKTTKTISSEIVEKGNRKGQTRTVTQTNSIQEVENTIVSVTEYEAKVGDTTVTLGGKTMTVKEFKEEFPLDEDYQEVFEGLDDDAKITVRKVKRTPTSSRFDSFVSIMSNEFGKMDVGIKKDDAKYNAELAALEQPVAEPVVDNVEQTKENTKKKTRKTKATTKGTEQQQANLVEQSKVLITTPLFRPTGEAQLPNVPFFDIQEKIVQSLNQEVSSKKNPQTAIVDFFTLIEDVLGVDTLNTLEAIFNEVQNPNTTKERISELRTQFMGLMPSGFVKKSALTYMFDKQMLSKITPEGGPNLNATEAELLELNKNRTVTVKLASGIEHKNVIIRAKDNTMLYLIKGGKADGSDLWLKVNRSKDKVTGLLYPQLGARPTMFTDLNVLTFTILDSNGKVQKYSKEGNKDTNGEHSLLMYLPTTKSKEDPSEVEKSFDELRRGIVEGKRVRLSAPVDKTSESVKPLITLKNEDGSERVVRSDYAFEFSVGNVVNLQEMPSEEVVASAKQVTTTIANPLRVTQESTIKAVEKMIADSKNIPDPDKVGYIIKGKKYERQSAFVKRVLGDNNVETENSEVNMEMGAAVGNFLDILGRDILGGNKVKTLGEYIKEAQGMGKRLRKGKGYELLFTQAQFDDLVAELEAVRDELTGQGWKLFTEGLIIHREFTEKEKQETGLEGVAGAMDILAVDPEGRVHIIDFKNKKFKDEDRFVTTLYSSKQGYPSNVSKWSTQQTTYAILGEDFGLPVDSISILAFASQYSEEDGAITIDDLSLGTRKTEVIAKHKSAASKDLIKLSYDAKIIKQINTRTAKPSAPKPAATISAQTVTENIPEVVTENAQTTADVLSSSGINLDDYAVILPQEGTMPSDAINEKPC